MLSVFDKGPFPPCPKPFNMAAHVLAGGTSDPQKTALSVLHRTHKEDWSFAQLERAIRGIATGFLQLGLTPGQRILFRLGNTPQTPLAYLAAIAVDLVPVPTSSQLTEPEVTRMIDQIEPSLILHDRDIPCPVHPQRCDAEVLNDWRDNEPAEFVMGAPERPAYIVFTSGTSGQPQAVVHAHRAIWARQMMIDGWYGLRSTDRLLHAGAFNWTYTMGTGLMDPWSKGATSLIPAPEIKPNELADLVVQHKATIFAAAPGVFRKLEMSDNYGSQTCLRHGLSAGEKLGQQIREKWVATTGTQIYEAYGMSECSTFISSKPGDELSDNWIGQPQIGRKIAIVNSEGTPMPRGTAGTIAVYKTDPGLMLEYLNAPDATASRFANDWFLTGDQAMMDSQDNVTFLGRSDDMMNAGGYRVSPLEVEAALANLPGVDALAVADIEVKPDVRVVMAFYTSAVPLDSRKLLDYAEQRLAKYKQPRDFIRVTEMPTGPNGKLRRSALNSFWRPHDQT